MRRMVLLLGALALTTALVTAPAAIAAPLTWTLNNAVFNDGGTVTGSFVWDAATYSFGDYSFTVSGGDTATFTPFTYTNANASTDYMFTPTYNFLYDLFIFGTDTTNPAFGPRSRTLYILPSTTLTDAGGSVALDISSSLNGGECYYCDPSRPFVSGSLSAAAVPEPASWAMMVAGFGLVGAMRRRRAGGVPA